jgi:hypothetical protein
MDRVASEFEVLSRLRCAESMLRTGFPRKIKNRSMKPARTTMKMLIIEYFLIDLNRIILLVTTSSFTLRGTGLVGRGLRTVSSISEEEEGDSTS